MKKKQPRKKGAVLILVLIIISSTMVMMLEATRFLSIEYSGSAWQRSGTVCRQLLYSGTFLAQRTIETDSSLDTAVSAPKKEENTSSETMEEGLPLFTDWTFFEEDLKAFSDDELLSGKLSGFIENEDGRLSLNALYNTEHAKELGEVFVRIFENLSYIHKIPPVDGEAFLQSIRVWMGAKDTELESQWYSNRPVPYTMPKKKFNTVEELLLVRWPGVSTKHKELLFYGNETIPGLKDILTVWGEGKINMNTAPKALLYCIVAEEHLRARYADRVYEYRLMETPDKAGWYKEIAEEMDVDINEFPAKALTNAGSTYRVHLTATAGVGKLHMQAIIAKKNQGNSILLQKIY